jgi:hypothetical protein
LLRCRAGAEGPLARHPQPLRKRPALAM